MCAYCSLENHIESYDDPQLVTAQKGVIKARHYSDVERTDSIR